MSGPHDVDGPNDVERGVAVESGATLRAGAPPARPAPALAELAGPQQARAVRELHHDMRQPLAAILALVGAAEAQPEVPDMVRACLDQIAEESRRMLALCRSVLEQRAAPRPLSIGHLAYSVAESCQTATGCRIEFDIDHVLAEVDEVGLRRAVGNLLDNAARAAGPSGRILLSVGREGTSVRISVAVSGPGFAAGPPGAASLGLDIVRRLAAEHGGRLEMATSPLGGALVTLVLPAPFIDLSTPHTGASDLGGPAASGSCLFTS